jgi:predicted transposase/invertase (TIGR01784 family)
MLRYAEQQGIEKGMEKGREEGLRAAKRTIARNLLQAGLSLSVVAQSTGLSVNQIEVLKNESSIDK